MTTKTQAADQESPVTELGYTDAARELDGIIEEFEAGVIDVDRLVERLERATAIVDELDRRLRRTRMQVEELVPRLESIGTSEVEFAGADPADPSDPAPPGAPGHADGGNGTEPVGLF